MYFPPSSIPSLYSPGSKFNVSLIIGRLSCPATRQVCQSLKKSSFAFPVSVDALKRNSLSGKLGVENLKPFADDNTLFACDQKTERVISSLELDIHSTLEWFESNMMVANPSKFQLMFMGLNQDIKLCLEIDDKIIPPTSQVKMLGVKIDAKLKFSAHGEASCVKASRSVSAFSRVARYLQQPQKKLLYNSFIMANFKYCPLIWMFCGKGANNKINRIHKRALCVLFDDHDTPFAELLVRSNERTVHVRNLQRLMIEI